MSLTDTQIQFAAEFVTLIVAASGVGISVLRPPGLRPADPVYREFSAAVALAVLGFVVAGAAAFAHGSLIVTGDPGGSLGAARVVSALALLPLTISWPGPARLRGLMLGAAVCWAAAGITEAVTKAALAVDGLLVAGSCAAALAILWVSRSSVAAKVAASAATTLFLVVVVLAVALSAVISSSLQRDDLNQLDATARSENAEIVSLVGQEVKDSRFAADQLEAVLGGQGANPLLEIGADPPGSTPPRHAAEAVAGPLKVLASLYPSSFAYTDRYATVVDVVGSLDQGTAARLARDLQVGALSCLPGGQSTPAQGVYVEGESAWAAAAFPVCENVSAKLLGSVIAASPLGPAYLSSLSQADGVSTVALVSEGSVLASNGPRPSPAELRAVRTTQHGAAVGASLVSSLPVAVAPGSAPLQLFLVSSAANELSARTQLYRTLFLIALGGTVLALGLAVFVGDRITSGVRRLTETASMIGGGDSALRAEVRGDDEVAVLGTVFNSMLDSLQDQATALQGAADEETRLRNRMEAVVAGMTDALIAVDGIGRITDFNRAAEELVGMSSQVALGKPIDEVVSATGEDGSSLAARLSDPGPAPWTRIATLHSPDGADVPVAVSSGAVRGPGGEMIGNVFLVRDLRREREMERMKDEFLSRIGHELRTPLTPIKAYADLLLRKQSVPPEQAGTWYSEIRRSSDQLQRIVEMLEFSASSSAGRMLLRLSPLDLRGLVTSVTSGWATRLPANLTIGRRLGRDLPAVYADRRWLSRALDEVIGNAVKFSPDGGRIVVAVSRPKPPPSNGYEEEGTGPDEVEIAVSDQGIGMTREQVERMFGDFVQADASDTRTFGGLGLGLTLAQRVVQGHGGTIRCRSVPGRGTTLVIRLPVKPPAEVTQPEGSAVIG